MSNITIKKGNAIPYNSEEKYMIVHVCNNIGKWGKGFVIELGKWAPEAKKVYLEEKSYTLGGVIFVSLENKNWVANVIGQDGIYNEKSNPIPIKYDALRKGLNSVGKMAEVLKLNIRMPKIGTGLAKGNWETILEIIKEEIPKTVNVEVFEL